MSGESTTNTGPAGESLVNWETAYDVVGGDRTLLIEVVDAFLQEAPAQMAAIDAALRTGDAVVLRRAAHTLKGSFRYFGVQTAYDVALELEIAGQEQRLDSLAPSVDRLRDLLQRTLKELTTFVARERKA